MKINEKSDIKFLAALVFFALASLSRFFDEKLNFHIAFSSFMQKYEIAFGVMLFYFLVLFVFYYICMANCEVKNKKTIYYLIAFYSTFAFPMFLSADYFGAMDVYAWILTWIGAISFVKGKAEWITVPICLCMAVLSPMSVLTGGCICIAIHMYKFMTQKGNRYLVYSITCFIMCIAGVLITRYLGVFASDAQDVLSLERFIVMVIFMSPYFYIAATFFYGIIKRVDVKTKAGIVFVILGAVPSAGIYIYLQDYARAFFHMFTYFILTVVILFAAKDMHIIEQMDRTKELIKKWFPVPVLILVVPFLFMTLWIIGEQVLMTEIFVDK